MTQWPKLNSTVMQGCSKNVSDFSHGYFSLKLELVTPSQRGMFRSICYVASNITRQNLEESDTASTTLWYHWAGATLRCPVDCVRLSFLSSVRVKCCTGCPTQYLTFNSCYFDSLFLLMSTLHVKAPFRYYLPTEVSNFPWVNLWLCREFISR